VRPAPAVLTSGASSLAPLENYIRNQRPAWTPVLQSVLDVEREGDLIKVRVRPDFAGKRLASNDGLEVLKLAYGVQKSIVTLDTPLADAGEKSALTPQQRLQQK